LSKLSKDLKQNVLGLKLCSIPVLGTKYFPFPWDLSAIFFHALEVQDVSFLTNKFQLIWTSFTHPNLFFNPNCQNCQL